MNLKTTLLLAASAAVSLCCAAPKVLIQDSFTKKSDQWASVTCFQPFSLITCTEKGAVLSRNEKQPPIKGKLFDTAFSFKSQKLTLPAGAEWFEVKSAASTNRKKGLGLTQGYGDGLWNRVVWYDKAGKRMEGKESYYIPRFRKDNPYIWQHRDRIPAGAVSAVLEFGLDSPDLLKGENIVLSGLQLTVGTEKEIKALPDETTRHHDPILISGSPVKDPAAPVVFEIAGTHADLKTARFYWDDKEITSAVTRKGTQFRWKPASPMTKGVHFLTAEVKDLRFPVREKRDAVVYYGPGNTKNVMTLRDDGMAMLNGKPFFCLGIACIEKQGRNGYSYDRAFQECSEAKINVGRPFGPFNAFKNCAKEVIPALEKYGLLTSAAPNLVKNDVDLRRIVKGVADQIQQDRFIIWDIGDDTADFISPEDLEAKNRAIKAVDPTRLTGHGDAIHPNSDYSRFPKISRYTPVVNSSDMIRPELYPIGNIGKKKETPEMTAKMVPQIIRDMKSVTSDHQRYARSPKCIWPLVQYFYCDGGMWSRMPTEAELRAMSYLCIIHGAHGLYWYRYAGYKNTPNAKRGYSDEEWNILKKLALEMRGMYDVLCARTGKQTQTVKVLSGPAADGMGFDSVNTLIKERNGTKYMFVCNSAMKPVKASFTVPGAKTGRDRFGKKNLTLKKGTFEDTLEGYGTRVYELK